jgi:hypothetical protein
MAEWVQIAFAVAGMVFLTGGAYGLLKQTRRDLNGLGSRLAREREEAQKRDRKAVLAFMLLAPEDKRQQIAELLNDGD